MTHIELTNSYLDLTPELFVGLWQRHDKDDEEDDEQQMGVGRS